MAFHLVPAENVNSPQEQGEQVGAGIPWWKLRLLEELSDSAAPDVGLELCPWGSRTLTGTSASSRAFIWRWSLKARSFQRLQVQPLKFSLGLNETDNETPINSPGPCSALREESGSPRRSDSV